MSKQRIIRYSKSDDWGILFTVCRGDRERLYSFELDPISPASKKRIERVIDTLREQSKHNLYRRKDVESFSLDEAIDKAKTHIERMRLRKQQTSTK